MGSLTELASPEVPMVQPKSGGVGGFLSGLLDVLKYGPFVHEAHQHQALRQQQLIDAQQDSALTQQFKQAQIQNLLHPKVDPHYWTANNGSLGVVDENGPHIIYNDPSPKTGSMVLENPDGTKTIVPTIGGIPVQQPQQGLDTLPQDFTVRGGGAASSAPRSFPVR